MGDWLSEKQQETWRAFLGVNTQITGVLDERLGERHDLGLTDYEILSLLSEAEDHQLRMSELAKQVLVSRSRLTYRIDQLAKRGVVERIECEDDGRGMFAALTDDGLALINVAAPLHTADVKSVLFDHIDEVELKTFHEILERLRLSLAS